MQTRSIKISTPPRTRAGCQINKGETMPNMDDVMKIINEEPLPEKKEEAHDVRDVNNYELYHKISELSRPEPDLIVYHDKQVTQLTGLFFTNSIGDTIETGIVAGQVNSSGYYILRYAGIPGIFLCRFQDICPGYRKFYDRREELEKDRMLPESVKTWLDREGA